VIDTMVLYSNNALAGYGGDDAAIQKDARAALSS
jgi:hypothetical protein